MAEYATRDSESLGDIYLRHVDAMTGERLRDKTAIAAELAWRDVERDRLAAVVKSLPTTADGVPIVPQMGVWQDTGGAVREVTVIAVSATSVMYTPVDEHRGDLSAPAGDFYSTLAAAMAAIAAIADGTADRA